MSFRRGRNLFVIKISPELQLTERFVNVDTGDQTAWYIFGKPETVKQLIDTYKLAVPYTHED